MLQNFYESREGVAEWFCSRNNPEWLNLLFYSNNCELWKQDLCNYKDSRGISIGSFEIYFRVIYISMMHSSSLFVHLLACFVHKGLNNQLNKDAIFFMINAADCQHYASNPWLYRRNTFPQIIVSPWKLARNTISHQAKKMRFAFDWISRWNRLIRFSQLLAKIDSKWMINAW